MDHCNCDNCADDKTVHTHGNIPNKIEAMFQPDDNNIKLWSKQNKMETK